jgi:hypothetical protein
VAFATRQCFRTHHCCVRTKTFDRLPGSQTVIGRNKRQSDEVGDFRHIDRALYAQGTTRFRLTVLDECSYFVLIKSTPVRHQKKPGEGFQDIRLIATERLWSALLKSVDRRGHDTRFVGGKADGEPSNKRMQAGRGSAQPLPLPAEALNARFRFLELKGAAATSVTRLTDDDPWPKEPAVGQLERRAGLSLHALPSGAASQSEYHCGRGRRDLLSGRAA